VQSLDELYEAAGVAQEAFLLLLQGLTPPGHALRVLVPSSEEGLHCPPTALRGPQGEPIVEVR
jgi:hypothetical protein